LPREVELSHPFHTLVEDGDAIVILDQTRLPGEVIYQRLPDVDAVAHAIKSMQVRGAPLIGATAAYGVALALHADATDRTLNVAIQLLAEIRPTAVNLHWARHLLQIRALQVRSGGITEFVPLPFVADEAPMYRKGLSRKGPTFGEAVLMHAVARLVFHRLIPNIQTSWVKMGHHGAIACLNAGCNDLGGTLMNERITRAAGAQHGQETAPRQMMEIINAAGRTPKQRTTLYGEVPAERQIASLAAAPLIDIINTPVRRKASLAA